MSSSTHSIRLLAATFGTAVMLGACGGGDDEPASSAAGATTPPASITCNTNAYVAGAVAVPTAAQLSAYAGTYNGDEGTFGPNPGDPFVKTGTATFVLKADGSATYKGVALTVTSWCVDKATNGAGGKFLYVLGDKWSFDVTDSGTAFGSAPPDGTITFDNGKKV